MVEIIAYYSIAGAMGLFIGWFSFRYQAVFVALAGSGLAGLGVMVKVFSPVAKVGGMTFWGAVGVWFQSLPVHLQNAICVSLFIAVGARIVTWWYRKFIWVETIESRAEMRARIFREYNYHDGIVDAYAQTSNRSGGGNSERSADSLRSAAGLR